MQCFNVLFSFRNLNIISTQNKKYESEDFKFIYHKMFNNFASGVKKTPFLFYKEIII